MDRSAILEIVIKHLRSNVDGTEKTEIDANKPMAEYGASSLDIVEVVSSSMREIGIGIPRAKLGKLRNINERLNPF